MEMDFCRGCVFEKRCDTRKELRTEQHKADQRWRDEPILKGFVYCLDRTPQLKGLEEVFRELEVADGDGREVETVRGTAEKSEEAGNREGGDEKTDDTTDSAS